MLPAQTLELKYDFADGPGTTTTDDPSSGIYPVTLNMISSSGAAADLHGAAGSGVQGQGTALNLFTNPIAGNVNGAYAFTANNTTLGQLGMVSNFTATIWFKMPNLFTNLANQGPRLWMMGTNGSTDLNVATTIGLQFGSRTATSQAATPADCLNAFVSSTRISPPIYYDFPTNVWIFCALTYDSVGGNAYVYYGTEASPAKLVAVKTVGAGTNFNLTGSASLAIGNRVSNARDFTGLIDDFRFYTGTGSASFIEGIRQASTPVAVTGLSPDGTVLTSGTNILAFTASSANGINTNNIKVAINGVDVSSSLQFSGTSTSQNVIYTNLPINPLLVVGTPSLNNVSVGVRITDNNGITTTNYFVYDGFSPTNYTWEAEDYDFNSGSFADNPPFAFDSSDPYYLATGTPETDYSDQGAAGEAQAQVYRSPSDIAATEFSVGAGNNGGNSIGELARQKILDALSTNGAIRDVDMGYFDGPATTGGVPTPGTPNWVNYTRTYPVGDWNVYVRAAAGSASVGSTLSQVTSGQGTYSQTTTNLGTFTLPNTGGWESFAWCPLRDSKGNIVRVTLTGLETLQLTANSGGGGNINFLMLIPANTNLPSIGNIYPNGTNMFQPASALTFNVSSPAGFTINPASISVQLTVGNLLGKSYITNITTANGMVVTGTSANRSVSVPLTTNILYTAVISATDVNGSPASQSVTFDTLAPSYTWEAPDYDYNGGSYVSDPIPVDGYMNLSGVSGIDYNFPNVPPANTYRDSAIVGVENDGDAPQRLQFLTGTPPPQPYDLGYFNSGDWLNYTRQYPAGQYNIFIRAADGSTGGALGNVGLATVTSGTGSTNQTTSSLGTFNIPVTGGWQTYTWVPLRDAGGNLVRFTGGSLQTLRTTSAGDQNVFFYALFPAITNLPSINNIYPDGTAMFQPTNKFAFTAAGSAGIATSNIVVTVNGTVVGATNLTFTGSATSWNVTYPLQTNNSYAITVTVTDANGNSANATTYFDTLLPTDYTWEAEDFDHDDGQFIENQTNAYLNLGAMIGVDTLQVNFATSAAYPYRTNILNLTTENNGMATEVNGDVTRVQYVGTGFSDYTMGFFSDGAWANYTRHYPAGTYNVYGRFASGGSTPTDATLGAVIAGWGTTNQTLNPLGTFTIPNLGWETYSFCPLRDSSGNLATVTFTGSTNTLQLGRPLDNPTSPDLNANFLLLVQVAGPAGSVTLSASISGGIITLSFPSSDSSHHYQVEYKNNLTDASWTPLGSLLTGTSGTLTATDAATGSNRFYRVQVE
jgi:hypothetical protein